MPFTTATRDLILEGSSIDELAPFASLHTADPGSTGASEIVGGSYTRESVTWGTASGGSKTFTLTVTFQIPAGTTFSYFGFWSAVSAGTWRGGEALTGGPQSYPTGGTFVLTVTVTTA